MIKKTKNLGVNETIVIDLAEELPTGSYNIAIPTGLDVADLGNVDIEDGKPRSSLSWLYSVLAILFLGGLTFLIYQKIQPKKKKAKSEGPFKADKKTEDKKKFFGFIKKGKKEGKDKYVEVGKKHEKPMVMPKKTKEDPKSKKKPSLTFRDKKKSLEDFKQRTLEEIKKTEAKINKNKVRDRSMKDGSIGYVTGRKGQPIKPVKPISPPPPKKTKEQPASPFNIFD